MSNAPIDCAELEREVKSLWPDLAWRGPFEFKRGRPVMICDLYMVVYRQNEEKPYSFTLRKQKGDKDSYCGVSTTLKDAETDAYAVKAECTHTQMQLELV